MQQANFPLQFEVDQLNEADPRTPKALRHHPHAKPRPNQRKHALITVGLQSKMRAHPFLREEAADFRQGFAMAPDQHTVAGELLSLDEVCFGESMIGWKHHQITLFAQ